ncbi:hypothetical protein EJB05_54710, partial [Eragrostis curvula]
MLVWRCRSTATIFLMPGPRGKNWASFSKRAACRGGGQGRIAAGDCWWWHDASAAKKGFVSILCSVKPPLQSWASRWRNLWIRAMDRSQVLNPANRLKPSRKPEYRN